MQDLTLEEIRWHAALGNATMGVWDLNPQAERVHYSPQWRAKLGFGVADAPDSTSFWRSRVHPDDFNPMLRALRLHLDGYTPSYDMRFRLRGGNFRYVTVMSRGRVVERNARGDAVRMVGTMVDPTGRMSVQLQDGLALPAHSDRPAPEFAATASASSDAANQSGRRFLSPLDASGRSVLHQVSDLLDIAVKEGTASAGAAFPAPVRQRKF